MTKRTAKKGMVEVKVGLNEKDFDYDYLQAINYDDKRTLKQVIETIFGINAELKKELVQQKDNHDKEMTALKKELSDNLERFNRTFEKNIKEWLTK